MQLLLKMELRELRFTADLIIYNGQLSAQSIHRRWNGRLKQVANIVSILQYVKTMAYLKEFLTIGYTRVGV